MGTTLDPGQHVVFEDILLLMQFCKENPRNYNVFRWQMPETGCLECIIDT